MTRAVGVIGLATLLSRLLGLVRTAVIAWLFSATGTTDAFFVAFRLPNLLRELAAEGSMSAGFIPVFTQYLTTRSRQEARQLANASFSILCVLLAGASLAGLLAAPWLVRLIAPGFVSEPEKFELTILLTRIMFPFLLFIALAALTMGVLNSLRSFRAPALSSSAFNVCVIVLTIGLAPLLSQPIVALAIGVLIGGLAQFAVQWPTLSASGMAYRWEWNPRHPGLRRMLWLILPTTIGLSVSQVNLVVNTILASFLPEGSVSYISYAMLLIQFPLGLFGVAVATAILPTLSTHASLGEREAFRDTATYGLRLVFFITAPAMAGLIFFGKPIIQVLFEHHNFGAAATTATADALVAYAVGLWAFAGVRVAVKAFYANQDTKRPVRVAVVCMLINVLLNLLLMGPLQHVGLALATSLASIINFLWLVLLLHTHYRGLQPSVMLKSHAKVLVATLGVVAVCWPISRLALWNIGGAWTAKGAWLTAGIGGSIAVYVALSIWMRCDELQTVWQSIRQKLIHTS